VTGPDKPDDRALASARLLIDLVTNTLDPGYAEAAARREAGAPRRRYDRPAVAVGCLLVGFLLVLAYVHTHRGAPEAAKVHDSLVSRVRAAETGGNSLAARVRDLERQLAAAQDAALPKSGAIARDLDLAQLQAGQLAVSGPGITVTLREPAAPTASPDPGRGGTTAIGDTNILTDRDVRSVVNELWHDGAEAISVNDVRLTPTSAIRFAGEAVLVDFQPITSPYRIRALGDADNLSTNFAESSVASRYQTLVGVDGIGFGFTESGNLKLPGSGPVKPRYASVPPTKKRGNR
jgi:uncharacterized protein YlxW (UPF0749 family)